MSVLALLLLPALIGMFWGAPLITRELDAGTHRLAWSLTTRTRWLTTKLLMIGLAAMAATGLLSLAVSRWSGPIDAAVATRDGRPGPGVFVFPRLSQEIFDARGITPLGYAAFMFVAGVLIGAIARRTLPSMAILLVVFTAVQITMSMWVRPHLIAPEQTTETITSSNLTFIGINGNLTVTLARPGAWVTSQHTILSGHPAHPPAWAVDCPPDPDKPDKPGCFSRLRALGYRQLVSYQPAGRFWALQTYETALYLAATFLLCGLCTWWIRNRLS